MTITGPRPYDRRARRAGVAALRERVVRVWEAGFPGRYEDVRGGEGIDWRMRSVSGTSGVPYSPGGHGLLGIRCHRDAKAQYLAVVSKADYWRVPVTEDVPETYLCDEYERRIPGTGYRG